jgi:hypothetical protein
MLREYPTKQKGNFSMQSNDPETEFYLSEMFGDRDSGEQFRTNSLRESTDTMDKFLGRSGFEESAQSNAEPSAVSDLREFVKGEKQKIPAMTRRELRSSMVQVLRKTADALAAI